MLDRGFGVVAGLQKIKPVLASVPELSSVMAMMKMGAADDGSWRQSFMAWGHGICHGSGVCPCHLWPEQEGTQPWCPAHSLHPCISWRQTTALPGGFEALEGAGRCVQHRDAHSLRVYFVVCQAEEQKCSWICASKGSCEAEGSPAPHYSLGTHHLSSGSLELGGLGLVYNHLRQYHGDHGAGIHFSMVLYCSLISLAVAFPEALADNSRGLETAI